MPAKRRRMEPGSGFPGLFFREGLPQKPSPAVRFAACLHENDIPPWKAKRQISTNRLGWPSGAAPEARPGVPIHPTPTVTGTGV